MTNKILTFSPLNRHLLVRRVEDESEKKQSEVNILLPEEYKPRQAEYAVVEVIKQAPDCTVASLESKRAIVENSMIKKIEYGSQELYIILENYVLCMVDADE